MPLTAINIMEWCCIARYVHDVLATQMMHITFNLMQSIQQSAKEDKHLFGRLLQITSDAPVCSATCKETPTMVDMKKYSSL